MAARGAVSPLQPPTSESCRSMIVVLRASWEAVFLGLAPESRFVPLFEVDRRQIVDRRVASSRVVPALDEVEHDRLGHGLRLESMLCEQLALEGGEERLAHRVVEA